MEFEAARADRWAVVLAGGEGMRLRPLTRRIAGDERPKQFCPVLNGVTMLECTRARVARLVRPDRTCLVLTRSHERFYAPLLAANPPGPLVIQPGSRGTASAILYGLLRVAEKGPSDAVALFPSDHYVSDDAHFMSHVEAAFDAVEARPKLVILLGMEADRPEREYGWIEAGAPILDRPPVYRVRRFWEKPSPSLAGELLDRGCLWNSFVLVARVPALLAMLRDAVPRLYDAFMTAWLRRSVYGETEAMESLYASLPSSNFSQDVLGTHPAKLAVLPVRGLTWSDWGNPVRVLETLDRVGIQPDWPERPEWHESTRTGGEMVSVEATSPSGR
jgi:mannose-1-phosphate guanylyltransferase